VPGVLALPLIIVQCDAVISLIEDDYYDRAWCSLEALIIQTLKKSQKKYLWYEQKPVPFDQPGATKARNYVLSETNLESVISLADKSLTFEVDRPKVLFLERQSKLLGF
jgi:hypothetical protein